LAVKWYRIPHRGTALCALWIGIAFGFVNVSVADPGDVNGDGIINLTDLGLVKDHLVGRVALTGDALLNADANEDAGIDVSDLVWIAAHQGFSLSLPGNVTIEFVLIPSGSFQMGSPDSERAHTTSEAPVHTVTLDYNFFMGKTEVTQKQWLTVMGSWPSSAPTVGSGLGDNYPAYNVSWTDAQDFLTALNEYLASSSQSAVTVRLPTEAEWEYACRATTQSRFYFGDSLDVLDSCEDGLAGTLEGMRTDYMWYCGNNTPTGTKEVATKWANQWGLFDMSGNVLEWCEDWYHTNYTGAPTDGSAWVVPVPAGMARVVRGGFWQGSARNCRAADRGQDGPDHRSAVTGFRIVAVIP